VRVVWLVMLVGCYDPDVECPLNRCDPLFGETPIGAVVDASAAISDASPVDGMPTQPPADAPSPQTCAPGCAGTCDDGVCVISCVGTEACDEQVVCPLTGPCRVVCNGRKACKQGVRCGLGHCTVTCQGKDACDKRVRCETSCACDVTCGVDACKDEALCPKPWCEAEDGCTSAPNSCASCP
jgi:hypothetical protein